MERFKSIFGIRSGRVLNILILGFYDRSNTGDEMYKEVFPILFQGHKLTFKCTDDISAVPGDVDIVVCGGGEIINAYFMNKIEQLTRDFCGQIYAVSVNLSGDSDAKYLHLFDHVFMRNKHDFNLAKEQIGDKNCTYLPDITYLLPKKHPKMYGLGHGNGHRHRHREDGIINIGLCMAQPVFYENPKLVHPLCEVLTKVMEDEPRAHLHLINFNNQLSNAKECDILLNEQIVAALPRFMKQRCTPYYNANPLEIYKRIGEMNFNICMRYHSVVFSLLNNVPFFAIYKSRKIDLMLKDNDMVQTNYKITNDKDIDVNMLYHMLKLEIDSQHNLLDPTKVYYFDVIKERVLERKQQVIHVKNRFVPLDFEGTLTKVCTDLQERMGVNVLDIAKKGRSGKLTSDKAQALKMAKLICYSISGNLENNCLWGLANNMITDTFVLREAIKYVYGQAYQGVGGGTRYYPPMKVLRRCLLNVDPYFNNEFTGLHRSGWKYVVGGLMNLNAGSMARRSNIILDTYVDRTFHWGQESVHSLGLLPYKTPWVGIIHHTFEESHSKYNCKELLVNPCFIESLRTCKSLIALSEDLAQKLTKALKKMECTVPVYWIHHPTEFVRNVFTMEKFGDNENKKVIQIGAWLRNPYAIYQLPLDARFKNPLKISKAVLRGREMASAFKPDNLLKDISKALGVNVGTVGMGTESEDANTMSGSNESINKYNKGLMEAIACNDRSVEVIEHMKNDDYDELLSKNIVFLNLVDCSAVNTVIECIARNTPLLVNRLPALEELLGPKYPGFYENFVEAAYKLGSEKKIRKIHDYLCNNLDKSNLHLEEFLNGVMSVVVRQ